MDNSIDSVQSSKSGKFNRFQFRKEEKPSFLERKEPIFVFTGKSRERNNDRSVLSKHSLRDKESDTSKLSDNEPILKGLTNNNHKLERSASRQEREASRVEREYRQDKQEAPLLHADALNAPAVREILRQVKGITDEFRKVIAHFAKKYRDMRYEWDRSFKTLLSLQVSQETQAIKDLKGQLERRQEELE
jgi:predicted ribosome quality control (RQC) complex YloA/Tae2 family protein